MAKRCVHYRKTNAIFDFPHELSLFEVQEILNQAYEIKKPDEDRVFVTHEDSTYLVIFPKNPGANGSVSPTES